MVDSDESVSERAERPPSVSDTPAGGRIRPPQTESDVNGGIGGEKGWAEHHTETSEELMKRREGQRRAEEREMVRRAARRLIVFGHSIQPDHADISNVEVEAQGRSKKKSVRGSPPSDHQRKCEALMNGSVVEPSFAKGNWAIRWRERV